MHHLLLRKSHKKARSRFDTASEQHPACNYWHRLSLATVGAVLAVVSFSASAQAVDVVVDDIPSGGRALGSTSTPCSNPLIRSFTVNSDFLVSNISVGLNITHNYRGATAALLEAPSGNTVQFLNINGSDRNRNYDVLFRNGGAVLNDGTDDNVASPFYDRTVRPGNTFSTLFGESAVGTWRLLLCDGGSGLEGRYNRAQLTLSSPDISGLAFDDVNSNNNKEPREGILANIGVTIYRDDGDGIFEPGTGDVSVSTSQTNAAGSYAVGGLTNGNYWIDVDETDPDLAGRTYGGSTAAGTADPRLITFSGTSVTDVNFPFTQDLQFLCDAGDPQEQLAFIEGAVLEAGSALQVGAVYRFANIFANMDGLVEVIAFNGGASLASIDNDSSGVLAAFQPTLNGASATTSSVDFKITFVNAGTSTPIAIAFKASGVDIDGDGGTLREFIELTGLSSFTIGSSLTATAIQSGTRFESNTTTVQPGVSAAARQAIAIADYSPVSELRYRIGAIDGGNSAAIQRLNSLYFGCTAGPAASVPDVLLVKRITAVNSDRVQNPNDNTPLNTVENDGTADSSDDNSNWPASYLVGAIDGGSVRPLINNSADAVEYSIYFLSAGSMEAKDVLICDRIPPNTTFLSDAYASGFSVDPQATVPNTLGMLLSLNGNEYALTGASDGDGGYYFPPGTEPSTQFPNVNCNGTNDNGAVVIALGDLPQAVSAGTPADSYGVVRFQVQVD